MDPAPPQDMTIPMLRANLKELQALHAEACATIVELQRQRIVDRATIGKLQQQAIVDRAKIEDLSVDKAANLALQQLYAKASLMSAGYNAFMKGLRRLHVHLQHQLVKLNNEHAISKMTEKTGTNGSLMGKTRWLLILPSALASKDPKTGEFAYPDWRLHFRDQVRQRWHQQTPSTAHTLLARCEPPREATTNASTTIISCR